MDKRERWIYDWKRFYRLTKARRIPMGFGCAFVLVSLILGYCVALLITEHGLRLILAGLLGGIVLFATQASVFADIPSKRALIVTCIVLGFTARFAVMWTGVFERQPRIRF